MNKTDLEQNILVKEHQIEKLRDAAELSPVCAELYNKAILEKAILKDELKRMTEPVGAKISAKIRSILSIGEKRICDYFKS